jgi:hypothetical protein
LTPGETGFKRFKLLPFLKRNKEASASTPMETILRDHDEDFDAMEAAGQDLIDAVHAKDAKLVAEVLKAVFELMESHDEVAPPTNKENE